MLLRKSFVGLYFELDVMVAQPALEKWQDLSFLAPASHFLDFLALVCSPRFEESQCVPFVNGYMIGLVAWNEVLRYIPARHDGRSP